MRLVVVVLLACTLSTCKKLDRSSSEVKNEALDYGLLRQYVVNFLFAFGDYAQLCEVVDDGAFDNDCFRAVASNTCKGLTKGLETVLGDVAKNGPGSENVESATATFKEKGLNAVRDASRKCIEVSAEPIVQEIALYIEKKYGVELIKKVTGVRPAKNLKASLAKWACTGGAKALGDVIEGTRSIDYENSCKGVLPGGASAEASRSRVASCLRTASDVCSIATDKGNIQLDNFLPESDSELEKLGRDIAGDVASGLCKTGGAATKLSCSVISAAAGQIKSAIVTGDNDWANCLGTTQLGACLGTIWGSEGFTNNSPIETSQQGQNAQGEKFDYVGCCLCNRERYAEYSFSSELIETSNYLSVIQGGDFASGNCAYQENRGKVVKPLDSYMGYPTYYLYKSCQKRYVAGQACAARQDGKVFVWNPDRKIYDTIIVSM